MSWTSPSPAGGAQPPEPPPYAYPPPPWAPMPAPPRKRRTGLIVLLIALPLALIIGASAALIATLGGEKLLSDAQGRVALTVPRTWSNDTGPDAGQDVEQGEESYTIPDIETGGFSGSITVFIEPRADTTLTEAHEVSVEAECDLAGCIGRGTPTTVEVNGRRGFEQTLTHPEDEATIVLTLESETLVVSLLGYGIAEDRDTILARMRTVVINR